VLEYAADFARRLYGCGNLLIELRGAPVYFGQCKYVLGQREDCPITAFVRGEQQWSRDPKARAGPQTAQTVMFLLVVANGFFADVAYGAQDPRWNLPVSPVLLLIAAVAARTIYLARPATGPVSLVSTGLLVAGALVPSSLTAWMALFTVSAIGILFDRPRYLAHQLPLALAVTVCRN
jgi:hypothetical protein